MSLDIYSPRELWHMLRFYRLAPLANQQARQLCKEIIQKLRGLNNA